MIYIATLVVNCLMNDCNIYSATTRTLLYTIRGNGLMRIQFSPDGRYIAAAVATYNIFIWSTINHEHIQTFNINNAAIISFDWSKNSNYF